MKQFSFERAQSEAEKMQEAIKSGGAKDYSEAEKIVGKKNSYAPEGWQTISGIKEMLNKNRYLIINEADKYRKSHPEWYKDYIDGAGNVSLHFSPELIEKLCLEFAKYEPAPTGWLTVTALIMVLNGQHKTITNAADKYRKSHPEWFKDYIDKTSKVREHYSPELIEKLHLEFTKYEPAPKGWSTASTLEDLFSKVHKTIIDAADKYRKLNPKWFKYYFDKMGNTWEHYSPELIEQLRLEFAKDERAPEGWLTVGALSTMLDKAYQTIMVVAEKYRRSHPEWFKDYLNKTQIKSKHFSPELVEHIKKELQLPEAPVNWQTKEEIAQRTGVSLEEAEKIIAKLKKQFPEQHGKFKTKNEG